MIDLKAGDLVRLRAERFLYQADQGFDPSAAAPINGRFFDGWCLVRGDLFLVLIPYDVQQDKTFGILVNGGEVVFGWACLDGACDLVA